jgi:hypothetical protein
MQEIDDCYEFHNRLSSWMFAVAFTVLLAVVTSAILSSSQKSEPLDQEALYATANRIDR